MAEPAQNVAHPADLGLALSLLLRSYLHASQAVLAELPGGPRGYHVLASAAYDCPPTQLALAHQLGIDRTVLTYLLDDLEQAGLIERKPDPADRRARRVVVTEAGTATLHRLQGELGSVENVALRGLDPAEQQTFRTLLQRAASHQDTGEEACSVVNAVVSTI
jgi:DNA-binding MarR family transcriptional regulator